MVELPEAYYITSDGLAAEKQPEILGRYDLYRTSFKGMDVLLYKKHPTSSPGKVYYMFNVTDDGDWIVGCESQEVILRSTTLNQTSTKGHFIIAPKDGWRLSIPTSYTSYHLVLDTSIRVRPDEDCRWSDWKEGACSKSCGGGFKTFNRQIIKRAIGNGECPGESLRVEHCNEDTCPKQHTSFIVTIVVLILFILLGCAVSFYLYKRGDGQTVSIPSLPINFKMLRLKVNSSE